MAPRFWLGSIIQLFSMNVTRVQKELKMTIKQRQLFFSAVGFSHADKKYFYSGEWLHKTLQLLSVRADMRVAAPTEMAPSLSQCHINCVMASVLNGVELILLGKAARRRASSDIWRACTPLPPLPQSQKKKDYSYISFPPTPLILSTISRGVVIATPTPPLNVSASS